MPLTHKQKQSGLFFSFHNNYPCTPCIFNDLMIPKKISFYYYVYSGSGKLFLKNILLLSISEMNLESNTSLSFTTICLTFCI